LADSEAPAAFYPAAFYPDAMHSEAFGGAAPDLAAAEPEEELIELKEEELKEEEALRETRKAVEETMEPDADAPAARSAPLAFLLDACIFLALCLPPAAIAFYVARLRKREKKAPNQPEG